MKFSNHTSSAEISILK